MFSAGAAVLFERSMRLAPQVAMSAGIAIGCGMLAFAATAVVSLRIMYGREVLNRRAAAAARRPEPVTAPLA